jgi:hypothetical protein
MVTSGKFVRRSLFASTAPGQLWPSFTAVFLSVFVGRHAASFQALVFYFELFVEIYRMGMKAVPGGNRTSRTHLSVFAIS